MKINKQINNTIFVSLLLFFVILPILVYIWVSNFRTGGDLEVFVTTPVEIRAQIVPESTSVSVEGTIPVSLRLVSNTDIDLASTFLAVLVPKDLTVSELSENDSLANVIPVLSGDASDGLSIESHNATYNKIQLSFLNTSSGVSLTANQPVTFVTFNITTPKAGTYPISFDTDAALVATDRNIDYLIPPTSRDTVNVSFVDGTLPPPTSINWKTDQVEFKANNFHIRIGDTKFTAQPNSITGFSLHSNSSPSEPTLEAIWNENGVEMRLFMYFRINENGRDWEMYDFRTYNGLASSPDWINYKDSSGEFLRGVVEQANYAESRTFIPVQSVEAGVVCGGCSITVYPPKDYSAIKNFTSTLRLDKRDGSDKGHAHPNVFIGLWRESSNQMLERFTSIADSNGSFKVDGFFSQNGSAYNLAPSDVIVIKPEGYLAKSFNVGTDGIINASKTGLHVQDLTNYYLGGDIIIDIGTFDVVNVRDYVLLRNYYGSESQQNYDRYFLDFNGNGYVDIRDFSVYSKNYGDKGVTEDLDRSIIDAVVDYVSPNLYQVIRK